MSKNATHGSRRGDITPLPAEPKGLAAREEYVYTLNRRIVNRKNNIFVKLSMNILYTNFHFAEGGGHTTYILSLLENKKHTAHVACAESSILYRKLKERGYPRLIPIDFYSKPKDLTKIIKNTRRLIRAIEEYDIDIVHTNGSPDNRLALYACPFCRKRFKIVFTKHNTIKIHGVISLWRLNKFNDAVIFVSEVAKLDSVGTHANPRYHVIENGVDLNYWRKQSPMRTGRAIRLISTAGTSPAKGWIHLAEALHALPEEQRSRFSSSLLGRPAPAELKSKAQEFCGMEFPGFFTDPRPLLEEADVGFILSYKEASSFACREMMAMGLPVISSDFSNHVRNIDESCGWVTRRHDAESVRQVLLRILAMPPAELEAMKLAARRKAERDFSLEKMMAETNAVYESLMVN
ncbi:MAG: glycosyltransferase family 4 protein [Deltaproteobacteria bacterium]|nr:glycosyltransferase family 4 protein [Deltaproteobacteria bacterium]